MSKNCPSWCPFKNGYCEKHETWLPVRGYESLYEVSDHGRVRSIDRLRPNILTGGTRLIKGRILKPVLNKKGYLQIKLCDEKNRKLVQVHILVANHFIPNPDNKPCVNHKSGIKTDNRSIMLEWNTHAENNQHAYSVLGRGTSFKGKKGRLSHVAQPIVQKDLQGNIIKRWDSIIDATRELGLNYKSIFQVLSGKQNSLYGFKYERV